MKNEKYNFWKEHEGGFAGGFSEGGHLYIVGKLYKKCK